MSKTPPPNPPAFPVPELHANEGMTLRDYFAAQAMAAMLSNDATKHNWSNAKVVFWAYDIADDMLDVRRNILRTKAKDE